MRKNIVLVVMFMIAALLVTAIPAKATSADDYKVIKNAVKGKKGGEVTWFRLEVQEKKAKKATVKIRIPIALVEALADTAETFVKNNKEVKKHCGDIDLKLILKILKKNGPMTMIEVDADDSFVKVWFE